MSGRSSCLLPLLNFDLPFFSACALPLCSVALQVTIGIDFVSKTMYLEDRIVRLQLWSAAAATAATAAAVGRGSSAAVRRVATDWPLEAKWVDVCEYACLLTEWLGWMLFFSFALVLWRAASGTRPARSVSAPSLTTIIVAHMESLSSTT